MERVEHYFSKGWDWLQMHSGFNGYVSKAISKLVAEQTHYPWINGEPNVQDACHDKLIQEHRAKIDA